LTQNEDKQNKDTTQKTNIISNTAPQRKPKVHPGGRGVSVRLASDRPPAVLLTFLYIYSQW